MANCLFCEIASGVFPTDKVYEDDNVIAFRDINPQAPTHILVIPKTHVPSAAEITAENAELVADCFAAIPKIAEAEGLDKGFRVINNCGEDGGQTVHHLHFHLLGGKALGEKLL